MKKFLWMGLILFVAFIGCNLVDRDFSLAEEDFADLTKGSLTLIMNGSAIPTTKTITPPVSMTVASYELIFEGPDVLASPPDYSGNFITSITSAGLYSKNNLAPGNWTVAVNAYNAVPTQIGAINGGDDPAYVSFTIAASDTLSLPITVVPISGNGDISLTVTWPDVEVPEATADIIAYLGVTNISSNSGLIPSFGITAGAPDNSAVYSTTGFAMAAGYYPLTLQLHNSGTLYWGWMESVRIVAGQTTSATWELLEGTLVSLTIGENPLVITFTSNPDLTSTDLADDVDLAVTAVPDPPDPGSPNEYTYQWYLDGAVLTNGADVGGATSANVTIVNTSILLSIGLHNLSVFITSGGGTASSETIPFTVVAP